MTSQQVVLHIEQSIQELDAFSNYAVSPEEIVLAFNAQYEKYIRDFLDNTLYTYPPSNRERGFQKNNRDLRIIAPLYKVDQQLLVTTNNDISIGNLSSLQNYRDYVKFTALISYNCIENGKLKSTSKRVKIRIENDINIEERLLDKYSKSNLDELIGSIRGNNLHIYLNGLKISNVLASYINNINHITYIVDEEGNYNEMASEHFVLNDDVAHEVISRTVIYLKGVLGNSNDTTTTEKLI